MSYGKSKRAGRKAIFESAFSRFILPLPVLFLPALGNFVLESLNLWPKRMLLSKFAELSLCTLSLCVALPWSIALFNQRAVLRSNQIDYDLRNRKVKEFEKEKAGTPEGNQYIEEFYFNKGL